MLELSRIFPLLVHGSFCTWHLHGLWHRENLTHQIVMRHQSKSCTCKVVFMCFGLQRLCFLSRRLVGFHHTTIHCSGLLLMAMFLLHILFQDAGMLLSRLQGMAGAVGLSSFHLAPTTSPSPSQVLSPTTRSPTSSSTPRVPSPTLLRHRTRT